MVRSIVLFNVGFVLGYAAATASDRFRQVGREAFARDA